MAGTAAKISVEPYVLDSSLFVVKVGVDDYFKTAQMMMWCGTEAEAQEKAAELLKAEGLSVSTTGLESDTLNSKGRPVETRPPAPCSHNSLVHCGCAEKTDPIEQAAPPRPLACGKPAGSLHPRLGLAYGCVLDDGHDGDHKPGGNCFAHGKYVGLKCPQWPKCAEEVYAKGKEILAAPAAIEQARPQTQPCQNPSPFPYHEDMCHICQFPIAAHAAAEPAPERTPPNLTQIRRWLVNYQGGLFATDTNALLIASYVSARAVAVPEPAAQQESGLMPSCTLCGKIMQGVCECGNKTGVSEPAPTPSRAELTEALIAERAIRMWICDQMGPVDTPSARWAARRQEFLEKAEKSLSMILKPAEASALGTKEE